MSRLVFLSFFLFSALYSVDIPLDKTTFYGKLPNGLTYYVKKHNNPHEKVSMRLVVKTGSCHEEDHEQGIAHFLEHLVFRGSDNFEDWKIIEFLESIGAPLDADTNAMTTSISTIFKLEVPKGEHLLKGITMLSDLGTRAHLKQTALDAERPVVINELMGRGSVGSQIESGMFNITFPNSRYAVRYPAGKVPIVKSVSRDVIQNFYKKWYTPDRMAVLVVGDVDEKQVIKMIHTQFSNHKGSNIPRKLPDLSLSLRTDADQYRQIVPQFGKNMLIYTWKAVDAIQRTCTNEHLKEAYSSLLATQILNRRINRMVFSQDSGAIAGGIFLHQWRKGHWFVRASFECYPNRADEVNQKFRQMLAHAKLNGFTENEITEAKKSMKKNFEFELENYKIIKNSTFIEGYLHHFLFDEPFEEFVANRKRCMRVLQEIDNNDLKSFFETGHMFQYILGSTEEFKLNRADANINLADYSPTNKEILLHLSNPPRKGAIKIVSANEKYDIERLKLENGMEVILKPNNTCHNRIEIELEAKGGQLSLHKNEYDSASMVIPFIARSGLGNLSTSELQLFMNDNRFNPIFGIDSESRRIIISGERSSQECIFQYLCAHFTEERLKHSNWSGLLKLVKNELDNKYNGVGAQYTLARDLHYHYNHPLFTKLNLANVNEAQVRSLYKRFFLNPADFKMVILGDFKKDEVKKLLSQYLAAIPSDKKRVYPVVHPVMSRGDGGQWHYPKGDPKTTLFQVRLKFADILDSFQTKMAMSSINGLFKRRFDHVLRKLNSKIYSSQAQTTFISSGLSSGAFLTLTVRCLKKDSDQVRLLIAEQLDSLVREGFSREEIATERAVMRESFNQTNQQNNFWLHVINLHLDKGLSVDSLTDWTVREKCINSRSINSIVSNLCSNGSRYWIYLDTP
ncbi:MAG: insulinase family protein [Rhabdochlamydiaceae bacterium]|nr:insulinase family protein [Candidatus Amphrikana amoebophyrae]